jgi:hypothetical protein
MPIAKSVTQEVVKSPEKPVAPPPTGIAGYEWEGVPIDVFRHFGVEMGTVPTKDIEQLREITSWAKSKCADEPSIGNILQKISYIRSQLGSPSLNEKSYAKVWQFVKAQRVIDEMTKRQDSLRGGSRWI